jgi:hypothetical protein
MLMIYIVIGAACAFLALASYKPNNQILAAGLLWPLVLFFIALRGLAGLCKRNQ